MTKDQIIKELQARIAELESELAKFKQGGRPLLPDGKLTPNARRVRAHRAKKKAAAQEKDT